MSLGGLLRSALEKSAEGRIDVPHLEGPVRAHLAAELAAGGRRPVLVGRNTQDAEALHRDLAFMLGTREEEGSDHGLLFWGAHERPPYEEGSPDGRATMERLATLHRLSREPDRIRALVLTPQALIRKLPPPSIFAHAEYVLTGEDVEREALLDGLARAGYNHVSSVEDPGTFSVRGGIIDVFSPHRTQPVRIDLFGDTVESIHVFDPVKQRNLKPVEDAVLLPVREVVFGKGVVQLALQKLEALAEEHPIPSRRLSTLREDIENRIHFFGIETLLPLFHEEGLVDPSVYLPTGQDWTYLGIDEDVLQNASEEAWTEARLEADRAEAHHRLALPVSDFLSDAAEVLAGAARSSARIDFPEVTIEKRPSVKVRWDGIARLRGEILKATRASSAEDVMTPVITRLRDWRSRGKTTLIVCNTRGQAERLRQMLSPKGVQLRLESEPFSISAFLHQLQDEEERRPGGYRDRSVHAHLVLGELSDGYVLEDGPLSILAEEQIFGQRLKRRRKRSSNTVGPGLSDLKDLSAGDYVVHVDYGIGLYQGMSKLSVNGVEADYLNIEYKGRDKLYLPVTRMKLIQKYVSEPESETGRKPRLDKLGAVTWGKTKKKVKDHLLKMAAELLRLYAMRSSAEGFALPAPDGRYRQFEAEFAFEPTPDQQKAIDDVLADLQKPHPMDRLICGDVGYGKTEVAMRGAMMALSSGKQVAVLVPTTVLAAQHFQVFKERFRNFGARIAIVSRFQSNPENKEAIAKLKSGDIDMVVGTHKLLGKDIQFKDLGLLVVDEEHRFGVSHKERLKKYRANVHVLSMSATPIPRTLHMGFMGVRDMSVIATPPEDRLAVKTEVHRYSEEALRDALLREIRRGGQCFVVHNRVSSIDALGTLIERMVPEARVVIGHGQMDETRLEKVMVDFMNKEYNVLLSTTIIESGVDIANANTIVVNRADRMGLAQLYQLKGRVGRAQRRGYAHFMIPAGTMSKQARQRIAVLQRFTELGAGFKVASHDLEIRGAGNIIGKQQSGNIKSVGFEMYQTLLKEAIEELKGKEHSAYKEPEIQVPVPSLLPESYVAEPGERLAYYQRLNRAETDEETYDVLQELTDLFGNPPAEVENLVQLMLVKQRMSRVGALSLDYGAPTKTMPARVGLRLDAEAPRLEPKDLVRFVQAAPQRRKLTPEGRLVVHLESFEEPAEILQQAKDRLDELQRLALRPAA
ncbi:MAG: transcription-repair coupling factor [Myxococcota bacterium]